jgi:glutathione S-transferase
MPAPTYHVIGNYLSPYVRKVLVCLRLKGLHYTIDPIAPFVGNAEFERLSPLRRIPVLIHGDRVINDSTVICQYLEDLHPKPALYPHDAGERAQARWLEEYADTRLGEVIVWGMFFQRGLKRILFKEDTDQARYEHARDVALPACLDWLEPQAPEQGFLFGDTLSIADISVASFLRNAAFVRVQVDATRWPRTAAWLERVLSLPEFVALAKVEDAIARVPLHEQRPLLASLGEPLSEITLGGASPRRGVMRLD